MLDEGKTVRNLEAYHRNYDNHLRQTGDLLTAYYLNENDCLHLIDAYCYSSFDSFRHIRHD